MRAWFIGDDEGGLTECERLREATMSAIAAVLSLLRRVTETRKGGVSRESALRHLAGWFTAAPTAEAAHALYDAVFGLGRPRHLSMYHPDADVIPAIRSWWDAPPLEIARTLAETGRPPTPGAPARLQRNDAGIRRLRQVQLDAQRARAEAARSSPPPTSTTASSTRAKPRSCSSFSTPPPPRGSRSAAAYPAHPARTTASR